MQNKFKNDTDFIKSLKNGEPKAYSYLVDSFHHKLCIYVFGLTNDYDYSEDIVQNVFINIWNKRKQLKDDFSIKNYLYRSVYNEFIDQYRKKKSVIELEKKYIDALSSIVEEDENSLDRLIKIVNQEIENLPPKCKQTFLLSKQDGLTNIEIAEYLNVSIKSVEAHITKAFSILRKTVDGKLQGLLFLLFGVPRKEQFK
ncbi:RNA polymerase sigma factor [Winogradskyella vidalii]|uniref:RNA polymerase sigma factor n=1 Tax=Winogradskyella vidalii TaxID=2615024 RepID=UPI0015C6E311|nr:sigma-70 family RNA polymerase sigma factor [Winogradskyella vidalii]